MNLHTHSGAQGVPDPAEHAVGHPELPSGPDQEPDDAARPQLGELPRLSQGTQGNDIYFQ